MWLNQTKQNLKIDHLLLGNFMRIIIWKFAADVRYIILPTSCTHPLKLLYNWRLCKKHYNRMSDIHSVYRTWMKTISCYYFILSPVVFVDMS